MKLIIKAMRNLCGTSAPLRDDQFMTCILKVKSSKQGWQRSVERMLRKCKVLRFQMDQNGMMEVSGIANPDDLLRKIDRSRYIELQWIQYGLCSSNLFIQQEPPKKECAAKEKTKDNYYYPSHPHTRGNGYGNGNGYGHPPPPVFRQLPLPTR